MKKINHDGYYLSTPFHYEDWHGGVKIERLNYKAFFFAKNGIVYKKGKQNTTSFSAEDFLVHGSKGEYTIKENHIEYIFKKGQRFEIRRQLKIHSLDLLSDQDQDQYHWTSFADEIQNEGSPTQEKGT